MNLQEFMKKYGNADVNEKDLKELLGIEDDKYFIPKEYELYYTANASGKADVHKAVHPPSTSKAFENNELFRTKEEAEEHARKQRFLLQMKRDFLDNSDELDWDKNTQFKYYLIYDHDFEVVEISVCYSRQYSGFYTTNKGWLENYVNRHEEEIKKYYFEVK